jgi:hypothetical protein
MPRGAATSSRTSSLPTKVPLRDAEESKLLKTGFQLSSDRPPSEVSQNMTFEERRRGAYEQVVFPLNERAICLQSKSAS